MTVSVSPAGTCWALETVTELVWVTLKPTAAEMIDALTDTLLLDELLTLTVFDMVNVVGPVAVAVARDRPSLTSIPSN